MAEQALEIKQPEFELEKAPLNPKTKEEHAYISGMLIQRVRQFINDRDLTEMINWGAGPTKNVPDISKMTFNDGVGRFGLFAAVKPDDLDLYRYLLPDFFSMPPEPILSLVTVDYNHPNPITRYREGMVMLKALDADGEEAWYVLSMPVETWLMMIMGHDWGFRKQLFDITVTREKTTVLEKNGDLYMSLELTPEDWTGGSEAVIPAGGCGGINNMAVIHPNSENLVLRFGYGQAHALDEERKMIKISVNPDLPWARLVPQNGMATGFYQRYIAVGDSYIKKVV